MDTYSLVLVGRYPGKDRAVAQSLAREFGRDDAWGLQVVGASPIVLLDNLNLEQANAVHAALADVENAGSLFQVQNEVEDGTAKIQWPAPPRLRGRLTHEFGAAMAASPMITGKGNTVSLILPCPYTGQKMKLVLSIQIQKAADGATGMLQPSMQISASATAAPHQIQNPQQIQAPQQLPHRPPSRGNPIPMGAQPAPAQQPQRVASSPSVPVPRQVSHPQPPQQVASPIIGLESLEELEPLEQFPPVEHKSGARVPRPVSSPPRSPGSGVPLPDVPVLHNQQAPRPSGLPDVPMAAPVPAQVSAPMDLEVFEQKVSSSGIFRAPVAAELAAAADAPEEYSDNGASCSVFMGKSSNARVHQLFAELTGMSVQDASRACQKAIVAIAKDVSEGDAQNIKAQFAAINVQVRITKRK